MAKAPKIVIVGNLPPPLGGVTVFVRRLRDGLRQAGAEVDVIGRGSLFSLALAIAIRRDTLFVLNTMRLPLVALAALLKRRSSTLVLLDHNHSRNAKPGGQLSILWKRILPRFRAVMVCNAALRDNYRGVYPSERLQLFSPFIAPAEEEREAALRTVPSGLLQEIRDAKKMIMTSAWQNVLEQDGKETYGLSEVLDLAEDLLVAAPDVRLFVFVGTLDETDHYLIQRAAGLPNVCLPTQSLETWPLLPYCDVFVRATAADGDSLSVKEALLFGVTVVATDLPGRPKGCRIYPRGDRGELLRHCLSALDQKAGRKGEVDDGDGIVNQMIAMARTLPSFGSGNGHRRERTTFRTNHSG